MSYTQTQYEMSTGDLNLTTTGDKADINIGYMPHVIRAVSVSLNAAPTTAGVVKFTKRPTFKSDVGRTAGDVAVINLLTTHAAGAVVYKSGLSFMVNPGEEVVVEVTTAAAAVTAARANLYAEPSWETAANRTVMKATT